MSMSDRELFRIEVDRDFTLFTVYWLGQRSAQYGSLESCMKFMRGAYGEE